MGVWRSRPALAHDPDVELGIWEDDDYGNDRAVAEAIAAATYFERLNELARTVFPGPRSLAELAFAAIPVPEPLDDWASKQVHFFGPAGVILETESLSAQNSLTNYFAPNNSMESVVDPALPGPSWAFHIPSEHYFDQTPVENPSESNPSTGTEIPHEIDFDGPEMVDLTPPDSPSEIEIQCDTTFSAQTVDFPPQLNFKVKTFGNCQSLGNRVGLPRLLRLRYSKFSVISKCFACFCVCSLVTILFIVDSV